MVSEDAKDLHGLCASPQLNSSLFSAILLTNSLYIGVVVFTNVVSIINADIGNTGNAYLMTFISQLFTAILQLFFAGLSDIVDRRYFVIGAQVFGVVGPIICATWQTINTLIAGSARVSSILSLSTNSSPTSIVSGARPR